MQRTHPRRRSNYPAGTRWGALIYYGRGVRNGEPAIKIGLSVNPRARARALGLEILAWHEGASDAENDLAQMFKDEALGNEWYQPSAQLLSHIAGVRTDRPLPAPLPARWLQRAEEFCF